MSKRSLLAEVPAETRRVAQAAFPKGTVYLRLRDELGVIYQDSEFAALFSWLGRPEESPGCAGIAVRRRLDRSTSGRSGRQPD